MWVCCSFLPVIVLSFLHFSSLLFLYFCLQLTSAVTSVYYPYPSLFYCFLKAEICCSLSLKCLSAQIQSELYFIVFYVLTYYWSQWRSIRRRRRSEQYIIFVQFMFLNLHFYHVLNICRRRFTVYYYSVWLSLVEFEEDQIRLTERRCHLNVTVSWGFMKQIIS